MILSTTLRWKSPAAKKAEARPNYASLKSKAIRILASTILARIARKAFLRASDFFLSSSKPFLAPTAFVLYSCRFLHTTHIRHYCKKTKIESYYILEGKT